MGQNDSCTLRLPTEETSLTRTLTDNVLIQQIMLKLLLHAVTKYQEHTRACSRILILYLDSWWFDPHAAMRNDSQQAYSHAGIKRSKRCTEVQVQESSLACSADNA